MCTFFTKKNTDFFAKELCYISSVRNLEITLLLEYVGCAFLSEYFTQMLLGWLYFWKESGFTFGYLFISMFSKVTFL